MILSMDGLKNVYLKQESQGFFKLSDMIGCDLSQEEIGKMVKFPVYKG